MISPLFYFAWFCNGQITLCYRRWQLVCHIWNFTKLFHNLCKLNKFKITQLVLDLCYHNWIKWQFLFFCIMFFSFIMLLFLCLKPNSLIACIFKHFYKCCMHNKFKTHSFKIMTLGSKTYNSLLKKHTFFICHRLWLPT